MTSGFLPYVFVWTETLREGNTGLMALTNTLDTEIGKIFNTTWSIRAGQVVPETNDVALNNGAVKLNAVVLYADLFNSTELARRFPRSMAAKIIRAYLSSMTRLISAHGGSIRSFDGDRVMGIFVGGSKNSQAAKCALKMNYVVKEILKPKAESKFPSLRAKNFQIAHCAGISRSDLLVVRGGIRGTNDLVFVGQAANLAAKLSEVRFSPWHTYVTWNVYDYFHDYAKYGEGGRNMWTSVRRKLGKEKWHCYKSSWHWKP